VVDPPNTGATEEYDGSNLDKFSCKFSNSKRTTLAGAGTQTSGLAFGGNTTTCLQAATEEWTGAGSPHNSYNNSFLTIDLSI
jgi:hypothetical protein